MKYANRISSASAFDIHPYEVVKKISERTIVIRRMSAVLDEFVKLKFEMHGWQSHCLNQNEQKWFIDSDPYELEFRIRLTKTGWKSSLGAKFELSDTPMKFRDYNRG